MLLEWFQGRRLFYYLVKNHFPLAAAETGPVWGMLLLELLELLKA